MTASTQSSYFGHISRQKWPIDHYPAFTKKDKAQTFEFFLLNQFYCTNTASHIYKLTSHIKFTTQNLLLLEIQLFAQGVNVRQLIVLIIMCIKGKPFGIKHQEYSLYLQSKEKDKQNESLKVRNCSKSLHSHRHR